MNTRVIWFRLEGCAFWFHKRCGNCWTVERLLGSEEYLCSMWLTRLLVQLNSKINHFFFFYWTVSTSL